MFVMANAITSALSGHLSKEMFESIASDPQEGAAAFESYRSRQQQTAGE